MKKFFFEYKKVILVILVIVYSICLDSLIVPKKAVKQSKDLSPLMAKESYKEISDDSVVTEFQLANKEDSFSRYSLMGKKDSQKSLNEIRQVCENINITLGKIHKISNEKDDKILLKLEEQSKKIEEQTNKIKQQTMTIEDQTKRIDNQSIELKAVSEARVKDDERKLKENKLFLILGTLISVIYIISQAHLFKENSANLSDYLGLAYPFVINTLIPLMRIDLNWLF